MKERKTEKLLVLGIDGMDPGLTQKFLRKGVLPNIEQFIKAGSSREDLRMLGVVPTITPPGWTSLATGAYPGTHGITCFWNQDPNRLDTMIYSLDSTLCKAEPLWNVLAETGYRTLVWHWPGSSWPPTSDSSNLAVVDGTQPGFVNFGVGSVDSEKIVAADEVVRDLIYMPGGILDTGAGCILHDLSFKPAQEETSARKAVRSGGKTVTNIMLSLEDGERGGEHVAMDLVNSPIRSAIGWDFPTEGAKEFMILTSQGLARRPALIWPNTEGCFDTVKIYKSKKAQQPIVTLKNGEMSEAFVDEYVGENGEHYEGARIARIMDLKEDGSHLRIWYGAALDIHNDFVWHPKSLLKEVIENVGYFMSPGNVQAFEPRMVKKANVEGWDVYSQWQANVLNYFIAQDRYDVIFSHLHNIDAMGHRFWHFAKERAGYDLDPKMYEQLIEDMYVQTDHYIGEFLPLLEQGWTILVTSDHGLICTEEDDQPLLGDPFGVNAGVMNALGYTALKTNDEGSPIKEIDWTKTKAIACRGCHIYINLKGRNANGIVDADEQYDLERKIIDDLYNYRDPKTGKRVVALAIRNKEAEMLGLSGPDCGDILYWLEEGFHRVHGDSLTTQKGVWDTSVSAIFMGAGRGIKKNFVTHRSIRMVDFAPTIAVLLGVRMPAECEGAPIYQILDEE